MQRSERRLANARNVLFALSPSQGRLRPETGEDIYLRISTFWIKIFSIAFGMGVVTGVVMPFQFGTNWSRFSDSTANVLSPLFAYEGLTAFFLEAAFLGVLLSDGNSCRAGSTSSLR